MRTVVKNNQKPVGMEYAHVTSIKATSLGLDCLVIKHWSSPWFYQETIALIGISGLIYLFNPYAYKMECTVNSTYFMQIIEYWLKFKQQSDYVNLINILSHIFKDTFLVKILLNSLCLITFFYFMCYLWYIYCTYCTNILVFKAVQTYKLKHNFVVCKYILNFVWSAQTEMDLQL